MYSIGSFDVGGKRVYDNFLDPRNFVRMSYMELITVEAENTAHRELLFSLMVDYIRETDGHSGRKTPVELIPRITDSMIEKLNKDRSLRIAAVDGLPVGFFYAKVDREGDRGEIRSGWGYVMEFYVSDHYRRRGLGRLMAKECEDFFRSRGAHCAWLTADGVTGVPFWLSVGYADSGEISKENGQRVFVKNLRD